MNFAAFRARAHEMYDAVPADFREGVDGLVVDPDVVPHPTLPDVYTLGECRAESYASEFGGPGDVRSFVHLFHGSFVRLAELDGEFDWEEELWETITHEIRHHLEWLASEDALEVEDYVNDQNFARREGEAFDPVFYRSGRDLGDGVYEVDGDVFVERPLPAADGAAPELLLNWRRHRLRVPLPERPGDHHFLTLEGPLPDPPKGDLVLVLVREAGVWKRMRRLAAGVAPTVASSFVDVGRA
jgi:hypothetical protein